MQYVKNSLRQLVGIEVLEVFEYSENIDLNEMYEAYLLTYQIENGNPPWSRLPFVSLKDDIYTWIRQNMEITEHKEYFLYHGVWVKIRILDAALAVKSLWAFSASPGFLLAEANYDRILEVGADSRDEENYLLDVWKYQR